MRPREGRRDWGRSSCLPLRCLRLVVLPTINAFAQIGTVPADCPRPLSPSDFMSTAKPIELSLEVPLTKELGCSAAGVGG